jgi:hypothetical protein
VPRGAAVRGKVTIARRSGRLHHPGELGLNPGFSGGPGQGPTARNLPCLRERKIAQET